MALPSSGPLSFSQINTELSRSATALLSLNDSAVRNLAGKLSGSVSLSDLLGKSSVIRKTISASVNNVILKDLFTATEWSDTTAKEVVVASGVIVGSTSPSVAAMRTGTIWGGTLLVTNNGGIRGAGGIPNSGAGGPAIETAGALMVDNLNGDIRGGGGAGGKGGTGGSGSVTGTVREPASGNYYSAWTQPYYTWSRYNGHQFVGTQCVLYWNGTAIGSGVGVNATSFVSGAYTYYRGVYREDASDDFGEIGLYDIYRTSSATTATVGGAGGAGARGQGSDGAAGTGANGSAGGTNAGAGGKGGNGGAWGAAGATGATGAAGNVGAGLAGVAGGAAGRAISYLSGGSVSWVNLGTVSGVY